MTDKTLASELFAAAGVALYGEQWQSATAALMGMDERTVRRIAKAAREGQDYRIAPSALRELRDHLEARTHTCRAQAEYINEWLAQRSA